MLRPYDVDVLSRAALTYLAGLAHHPRVAAIVAVPVGRRRPSNDNGSHKLPIVIAEAPGPGIDELASLLEHPAHLVEKRHMRIDILGQPLIHRRDRTIRIRATAVVLEQQILRH